MRLWSLNPEYLDQKGLVALWREGLLAKKVLENKTKAYKNHPQLQRFKESPDPLIFINAYLSSIYQESLRRSYNFNINKIIITEIKDKIEVSNEQLIYEFDHLLKKLEKRDPQKFRELKK